VVKQRITDLNSAASSVCAQFSACSYDEGAVFKLAPRDDRSRVRLLPLLAFGTGDGRVGDVGRRPVQVTAVVVLGLVLDRRRADALRKGSVDRGGCGNLDELDPQRAYATYTTP
jgi:hypothetical protein